MHKENITFKDHDGVETTRPFYFNISAAELAELELRNNLHGGFKAYLERVTNSGDGNVIMETFRDMIRMSYGVPQADGFGFLKSTDLSSAFMGSEAYSNFFLKLITQPDYAALFVRQILPQNIEETAERIRKQQEAAERAKPKDHQAPQERAQPQPENPSNASGARELFNQNPGDIPKLDYPEPGVQQSVAPISRAERRALDGQPVPELAPQEAPQTYAGSPVTTSDEDERAQFEAWRASQNNPSN